MKDGSNVIYVIWVLLLLSGKEIICMMSSSTHYHNCRILFGNSPAHLGCFKPLLWLSFLSSFLVLGGQKVAHVSMSFDLLGAGLTFLVPKMLWLTPPLPRQSMSLLFPPGLNFPLPCLKALLHQGCLWYLYNKYLQITHLL